MAERGEFSPSVQTVYIRRLSGLVFVSVGLAFIGTVSAGVLHVGSSFSAPGDVKKINCPREVLWLFFSKLQCPENVAE